MQIIPLYICETEQKLCKLIQGYLDETNEEGLFLFLDLEKAFDRVSYEYLIKATKAAGVAALKCNGGSRSFTTSSPHHKGE